MKTIVLFIFIFINSLFFAQQDDSVDVTFFYYSEGKPNTVYLPGEFNGWATNTSSLMTKDAETGIWSKTHRLRIGGPDPLPAQVSIAGAYQYKFNVDGAWIQDPLNPRQNPQDNNNSFLYINNLTIHLLLPNSTVSSGVIRTRFPEISAYIFPSQSSEIDLSKLSLNIDNQEYTDLAGKYDPISQKLVFTPPEPLGNGEHQLILTTQSSSDETFSDTTTFNIQADLVQLLTLNSETWKNSWRLQGAIFDGTGGFDSTITSAQIIRLDSNWTINVVNGIIDTTFTLVEGDNIFTLHAEINGQNEVSDSVNIIRKISHIPDAQVNISQNENTLIFSGVNSTDPEDQPLTYLWKEDPKNPNTIGINGLTTEEVSASIPTSPGEYYLTLIVKDADLNIDSTKMFFVIEADNQEAKIAGYNDNPNWLKNGRIYTLFFKAFTPAGTIKSAIPNLNYIKAMGFNIIWVLPVMEIPGNVDNQINIGYYISDLLNVESSYGTSQDFKDFINNAHDLDIKVILDVTPNHTGNVHPFAKEASINGNYSQYWNYYQTKSISHNTNGLGECLTAEGLYYYCAFSDVLLNYNWQDLDARNYMIDVYTHWVKEYDIDGYRFDVYWGPNRKYGEEYMGSPVRNALKKIKPDILLLGEDDGVGPGTEIIYSDRGGGLDASYDFGLYFDAIRNFSFSESSINTLHFRLNNDGFHPGENSYYLRFMESQDEERISYKYNSFEKTMPIASAIFFAPGLPMLYSGQEVGFGKGMGAIGEPDLNDRRRGIIDWNFGGKEMLTPHYQKLAQIRSQFPAFSRHRKDTNNDGSVTNQDESDFLRVTTGNSLVYSYLRPYMNSNGLTVINFGNQSQNVSIDLTQTNLVFDEELNSETLYWVNDLYNGSSEQLSGSDLSTFTVSLTSYGTAVYTISKYEEMVEIPEIPNIVSVKINNDEIPNKFALSQNYPNPFNPSTTINFSIPNDNSRRSGEVKLVVYDILGREIKILVNKKMTPGQHEVQFNADELTSGIYFYTLSAGDFFQTRKMILLK